MDYCSPCRRPLNGALVCPGCGAYAPDIAPPAHLLSGGSSGSSVPADVPDVVASDGSEHAVPTGRGRAARRRQLERLRKNRRRATLASVVALVGGGLTVAAMPTGASTRQTSAASAPEPVHPAVSLTNGADPAASSAQSDPHLPWQSSSDTQPPAPTAPAAQQPVQATVPQVDTTQAADPGPARDIRAAPANPQPAAPARTVTVTPVTHPAPTPTPVASSPVPSTPSAPAPSSPPPSTSPTSSPTSPAGLCVLVLCIN